MQTIQFLKTNNGDFSKLTEAFGIKVKHYPVENLYVLNYDQIESPKTNDVVMECRGLILDHKLNVVCRPFCRFFNYGEAGTEKFDFRFYTFHPKVDGSLIKVYFWNGSWRIATRGTAFAESNVGDWGLTFQELVLQAAGVKDMVEFDALCSVCLLDPSCTYLFELTAPENRVVTPYVDKSLTLLAVRNNNTGEYVPEWVYTAEGDDFWKANKAVSQGMTIEEIVKAADSLKNLEEGFVGYDAEGVPRVKVKSAAYVAVHHIRGEGLNNKRCCELVLSGEADEYLTYFPEDEPIVTPYIEAKEAMLFTVSCAYGKVMGVQDQKEFALAVAPQFGKSLMFTARKMGINIYEAFVQSTLAAKVAFLTSYMQKQGE